MGEVDAGGERIGASRQSAGSVDDHRYPQATLEMHATLEHQSVITHHVAVVAGEHDDRVVEFARALESPHDLANAVIDRLDHPVGDGDGLLCLGSGGTERCDVLALAAGFGLESTNHRDVKRPVSPFIVEGAGQFDFGGVMATEPGLGWGEWMVWIGEGAPRHPRVIRGSGVFDEVDGALGHEGGGRSFGGERSRVHLPPVR